MINTSSRNFFYFILILGLWTDFLDYLELYISLSKYIESFIDVFGKNKSIQNEFLDQENKNLNFPITILPKIWEQASDTLPALFIKKKSCLPHFQIRKIKVPKPKKSRPRAQAFLKIS